MCEELHTAVASATFLHKYFREIHVAQCTIISRTNEACIIFWCNVRWDPHYCTSDDLKYRLCFLWVSKNRSRYKQLILAILMFTKSLLVKPFLKNVLRSVWICVYLFVGCPWAGAPQVQRDPLRLRVGHGRRDGLLAQQDGECHGQISYFFEWRERRPGSLKEARETNSSF